MSMARKAARYRRTAAVQLEDRQWPRRTLSASPAWCSVDLRDGNQALPEPMDVARKLRFFNLLVSLGFKEIEVGFPSASQTEFDFVRCLIEDGHIPDDVTIQVITPAREHLIWRTLEALQGAERAIVNLYNSTSAVQRRVVFGMGRAQVVQLAVRGVETIRDIARQLVPELTLRLQYAPESFSSTELDFAVEICDAVMDAWGATPQAPMIINLPATVEVSTPNIYADQVEWVCRHLSNRERAIISVHPHNDRGTAVAAAELGQLAGAQRVEGTLFGNGERAGNVDLITLALNLLTQGVDPKLRLDAIDDVAATVQWCNRLPIAARHPYAGPLVHTTFAGSHQDAIHKGLRARAGRQGARWEVPYLPIDPADIGKGHADLVRINSQSGKGGIAHVMESRFGFSLPRGLQSELGRAVQDLAENVGGAVSPEQIWDVFSRTYLEPLAPPITLQRYCAVAASAGRRPVEVACHVTLSGSRHLLWGTGTTLVDALLQALCAALDVKLKLCALSTQKLSTLSFPALGAAGEGADEAHVAYAELAAADGLDLWGVAVTADPVTARLQAVTTAAGRVLGTLASVHLGEHGESERALPSPCPAVASPVAPSTSPPTAAISTPPSRLPPAAS